MQRIDRFVQGQHLPPDATVVKLLAVEKEHIGHEEPKTFLWAFVVVIEEPSEDGR